MDAFSIDTTCEFGTAPCSRFSLFYTFYGIAVALSLRKAPYISLLYALLLLVSLFTEFGLGIAATTLHFGLGFLNGLAIALLLHAVALAPHDFAKHKYKLILLLVELAVAALVFAYVDVRVPENGFPSGLWLSFLGYTLWFGLVFFINFKYGAYDTKSADEVVWYTRTLLYWWGALVPYYGFASIGRLSAISAGLLGCAVTLACTGALVYFTGHHRPPLPHPSSD